MKRLLYGVIFTGVVLISNANATGVSTSGGLTLLQPVGARPVGMASAYTAMGGEVCGMHYNPAGLAIMETTQMSLLPQSGIMGDKLCGIDFGMPTKFGVLGASLIYYTAGDIELINESGYSRIVDAQKDLIATLSLSRRLIGPFSLGLNTKILRSTLVEEFTATSVAFDGGALFDIGNFAFGVAIQNLGPGLEYEKKASPLPTTLRSGLALKWGGITGSFDIIKQNDNKFKKNIGMECRIASLAIRGGYKIGYDLEKWSIGAGIKFEELLRLDYGFNMMSDFSPIHHISLTTHFGKKVPKPAEIAEKPELPPKEPAVKIVAAVTGFKNVTGQKEYDWLSLGISELMSTFLSKIGGIKLVERAALNKVFEEYKLALTGVISEETAPQIGRLVGATNIIIGSYQMIGKEITINARMMKTETGEILRAGMASGKLTEVNSLVEVLVLKMVGDKLSKAEKRMIAEQGKRMMKTIEAISKGRLSLYAGDLDEARKYYKQALSKDPTDKAILEQIKHIDVKLKSIAIVNFKNNSRESGYDYLSTSIPEALTTQMMQKTALPFTERLNIEKSLEEMRMGLMAIVDEETAPELGKLAGASQLVLGSFEVVGKDITIYARLMDTETGKIIVSDKESGRLKNIHKIEEMLVDKLISQLDKVRVVEKKPPTTPATVSESKEAVRKAQEAFRKAKEAGAEKYAPEEFGKVKELIAQAVQALDNERYSEARNKAFSAEPKARELEITAYKRAKEEADEKARKALDRMREQMSEKAKKVELTLEESAVGFESGSAKLKKLSLPVLNVVADVLKQFPEYRIVIVGHTDSIGSAEYNQKLSERRARSVLNYMIKRGVASGRLTSIGSGESRPIASNNTEEGRAKNRRVEFMLIR